MIIFLDTSSLFKLYHQEEGTDLLDSFFLNNLVSGIYLSEIAKIEFSSTVWKKVRVKEITEEQAIAMISFFSADSKKYSFVEIDEFIVKQARNLLNKYGSKGLRTLDSIQFSTALFLRQQCNLFVTSDKLLNAFFVQELLPVF